jgi:voltage-gated potassium channel
MILSFLSSTRAESKLYFSLGEQDHVLDTGDILVVLGSSRDIKNFKKEIGVIE